MLAASHKVPRHLKRHPSKKLPRHTTRFLTRSTPTPFIPADTGENPDNAPSGHEYTLTEVTGDDVPELLVRTQAQMIQFVRIFSSDGTGAPVQAPEESLQTGASSAGGFRGTVRGIRSGRGVIYSTLSAGTGMQTSTLITVASGKPCPQSSRGISIRRGARRAHAKCGHSALCSLG